MTDDERESLLVKARGVPGETRESVRRAILELEDEGESVSVRAVKARATGSTSGISYTLAAWREGLLDIARPWKRLDLAPPAAPAPAAEPAPGQAGPADIDGLLAAIDAATSPSGIAEVAKLINRLVIAGQLDATAGRVALDACREQRMSFESARRSEPPKEDGLRMAPCSNEAVQLARAADFMLNGRRRQLLFALAAIMLDRDREESPNVDTAAEGGAETFARLGLDPYGEPPPGDPGLRVLAALEVPEAWERACRGETPPDEAGDAPADATGLDRLERAVGPG